METEPPIEYLLLQVVRVLGFDALYAENDLILDFLEMLDVEALVKQQQEANKANTETVFSRKKLRR